MKQWRQEFDTGGQDTCMNSWNFELQQASSSAPVITALEIGRANQGCPGHPKTISALVKGRAIDQIDIEVLAATDCQRSQSCGQVLGACVAEIKEGVR